MSTSSQRKHVKRIIEIENIFCYFSFGQTPMYLIMHANKYIHVLYNSTSFGVYLGVFDVKMKYKLSLQSDFT